MANSDLDVAIPAAAAKLGGRLTIPANARGLVAFAHGSGSGSGRHSPRNQYVAGVLHEARLGTLLFDLLTPAEETDRRNVFDIGLLATRLTAAAELARDWFAHLTRGSERP